MYSEEKAAMFGMDLTDDRKEIKNEKAILEQNQAAWDLKQQVTWGVG